MTRKSKRELEDCLDRVTDGRDYPVASLCTLLSTATHKPEALEVVDRDCRLWRVDGVLHRVPQRTLDLLRGEREDA